MGCNAQSPTHIVAKRIVHDDRIRFDGVDWLGDRADAMTTDIGKRGDQHIVRWRWRPAVAMLGCVVALAAVIALVYGSNRSIVPFGSRSTPTAGPVPTISAERLDAAIRFRRGVGLRFDTPWIELVEREYGGLGHVEPYGVALTPDEVVELEKRARNSDAVAPVVDAYGADHMDEYGGVYVDRGGVVIALFTAHLADHEAAIKALLHPNAAFSVALVDWTLADIRKLKTRIASDAEWLVQHGAFVTSLGTDVAANKVVLRLSVTSPDVVGVVVDHFAAGDLLRVEVTGAGGELLPKGGLSGRAVDREGHPVPNLEIELLPDISGAADQETNVSTDSNGEFRFPAVGATGYLVRLIHRTADGNATVVGQGRVVVEAGKEATLIIAVTTS